MQTRLLLGYKQMQVPLEVEAFSVDTKYFFQIGS